MSKGVVRTLIGVLALVALAGAAIGCGGDDETTSSLTPAQFKKQANAICNQQTEKRNEEIREAIEGLPKEKLLPKKEREQLVLDTLPTYAEIPEKLNALGAPEGDEEKVEAIAKAMEKAARDVEENPGEALVSTKQFFEASKLAAEYGLEECII